MSKQVNICYSKEDLAVILTIIGDINGTMGDMELEATVDEVIRLLNTVGEECNE